jgi:flagellar assembly protein FliH
MSSSPEAYAAAGDTAGAAGAPFATVAYPSIGPAVLDGDAVQRGYAAGLARGRARAEHERDELLAAVERDAAARRAADERRTAEALRTLDAAAAALTARVAPVLADAEQTLAEAALALAESVIGAELTRAPGGVARSVLDAVLARPEADDLVAVRMHPLAIAAVTRDAATGAATGDGAARVGSVRLVPDEALGVGDAVGDLPDGLLDATIAGALARARRALLGEDA